METTTVVARITQDHSHLAKICSKRSLALASIQTWCLDRLEEVPSFFGGIQSASNSIENCPHRREGVSEHESLGKVML